MAKKKDAAVDIEETKDVLTSNKILSDFLKETKDDHYNFEEEIDYKVSSGSLLLDIQMEGGMNPGLHRFCGASETGKTSSSLEFMRNFLKMKGAKAFYIKAEGRLSSKMRERSGIKFVFDPNEWHEGTCFVFETNIYETAVSAMQKLVFNNAEGMKYFFLLDSVDGLITKNDVDKTFEESNKVAGGAVIAGNFMKRMSIPLAKFGHIAIFISQVRADVKLDPYSKEPIRQTSATGGNALLHFANWILEFENRFKSDMILTNQKEKPDVNKNPILGHWAKVTVKKSPNEKTNTMTAYPIRYGRVGGKSVWIEKEIVDLLLAWELVNRKGAWYKPSDELIETVKEVNIELPENWQGENAIFAYIEENEAFKNFIVEYFKKMMNEVQDA